MKFHISLMSCLYVQVTSFMNDPLTIRIVSNQHYVSHFESLQNAKKALK